MRELLGPDALIVTPGVRPVGAALGDQSRVATPSQAIERGASHIVVGRPITGADESGCRLLTLSSPSWSKTSRKRFP